MINKNKLSGTMCYILRHHPEEFGLELDQEGYVYIKDLLDGLRQHNIKYSEVTEEIIMEVVTEDSKGRYQVSDNMIKCKYGHSAKEIVEEPITPPARLLHGTTRKAWGSIKETGLKKMQRTKVCLSIDLETATNVGLRRSKDIVIIEVDALVAWQSGVKFYKETENIYTSQDIPSKFLKEYNPNCSKLM